MLPPTSASAAPLRSKKRFAWMIISAKRLNARPVFSTASSILHYHGLAIISKRITDSFSSWNISRATMLRQCLRIIRGAFPIDRVLPWADQLLDALDYLHNQEHPVIHRDIKPQNLKINSRGEMILLDFGLAKGNPTDAGHQTAAKSIFGYSRNYASLEQIQGTGTDPRSDLYSLAATLYHLLTKIAPEDALTRAMSVLSQKPDPLIPASSVNPAIPRGVAGVIQKALDLNASGRPASADEMRKMLRDSEQYAYLADAVTVIANAPDSHTSSQPTKLMSDETSADVVKQTDIKTEVMPGYASQATAVKSSGSEAQTNMHPARLTSTPASNRSRFPVAAGALSLLLIGAAIAAGLYFIKPSVFGVGYDADTTADPSAAMPVAENSNTNVGSIRVGSETAEFTNTGTAESTEPVTKAEASKNSRTSAAAKPKSQSRGNDRVEYNVDDPGISPGGVVITDRDADGKTTTMRVNPTSPPPDIQRPPPNGYNPFPRGFDPSRMTIEQRRRFQKVVRNHSRPAGSRP